MTDDLVEHDEPDDDDDDDDRDEQGLSAAFRDAYRSSVLVGLSFLLNKASKPDPLMDEATSKVFMTELIKNALRNVAYWNLRESVELQADANAFFNVMCAFYRVLFGVDPDIIPLIADRP